MTPPVPRALTEEMTATPDLPLPVVPRSLPAVPEEAADAPKEEKKTKKQQAKKSPKKPSTTSIAALAAPPLSLPVFPPGGVTFDFGALAGAAAPPTNVGGRKRALPPPSAEEEEAAAAEIEPARKVARMSEEQKDKRKAAKLPPNAGKGRRRVPATFIEDPAARARRFYRGKKSVTRVLQNLHTATGCQVIMMLYSPGGRLSTIVSHDKFKNYKWLYGGENYAKMLFMSTVGDGLGGAGGAEAEMVLADAAAAAATTSTQPAALAEPEQEEEEREEEDVRQSKATAHPEEEEEEEDDEEGSGSDEEGGSGDEEDA
jgi:hypothetical protein